MSDMVMAGCASEPTDQLAGPLDLESNVHSWSQGSGVGTCSLGVGNALSYLYVLGGARGADSQVRRCHSPGLTLCGQQGLVLTLAAAAGWAAVCDGTHVADTVGHEDM